MKYVFPKVVNTNIVLGFSNLLNNEYFTDFPFARFEMIEKAYPKNEAFISVGETEDVQGKQIRLLTSEQGHALC